MSVTTWYHKEKAFNNDSISESHAYVVEECAVVRHNKQSAGPILQIILKPHDSANIQHVCRLIQQQKIRLAEESPTNLDC